MIFPTLPKLSKGLKGANGSLKSKRKETLKDKAVRVLEVTQKRSNLYNKELVEYFISNNVLTRGDLESYLSYYNISETDEEHTVILYNWRKAVDKSNSKGS